MRDIDSGWAWVVMIAAFGTQFVTAVLSYGVGVFHNAFLNEFKGDFTITSLVGSVFASLLSLLGPLVSFVINKWNCRTAGILSGICLFTGLCSSYFAPNLIVLLFTFGIVAGTGLGFSAITAVIVVGYSFEKYRGIAVGVNVAGAGIGMLAAGPFVQFLIDQYGLRGAFLILGAFGGQNVVFGALMRPTKVEMTYKSSGKNSSGKRGICSFSCDILREKSFLCILMSSFLWGIPYAIIFIHLPRFSVLSGSSEMQAASLITMIGLGSTVNRFLAGLVLGPGGIDPLLLNFGFLGIFGLTTVTFPFYCADFVGQNIYSFITGIYSGGLIVLINPLCLELVGISQLSTAVGLYFTSAGIACILGGPLAGFLIDHGTTYEGIFFLSGAVCLLGALSSLCSSLWRNAAVHEKKASSVVDFKESRFLSGSAYFSGSFTIVTEADNKHCFKKDPDNNTKDTTNYNSVESLFINKLDVNHKAVKWTLTQTDNDVAQRTSNHYSQQPQENLPLQIEEIRLLPTDSDS